MTGNTTTKRARRAKPTQAAPTAVPARDAQGFELDRWNLPIVGPVRAARLAELGKPDPDIEPDAWDEPADPEAFVPFGHSAADVALIDQIATADEWDGEDDDDRAASDGTDPISVKEIGNG